MDKEDMVCTCTYMQTMKHYSAKKKNDIQPFPTIQMDPEVIILRKTNTLLSLCKI